MIEQSNSLDRNVELAVMDWLQWFKFEGQYNFPDETLKFIRRIKSERDSANQICEEFFQSIIIAEKYLTSYSRVPWDFGGGRNEMPARAIAVC